jgi:hypothetical protein
MIEESRFEFFVKKLKPRLEFFFKKLLASITEKKPSFLKNLVYLIYKDLILVDWRVAKHLQKRLSLPFLFFAHRARL